MAKQQSASVLRPWTLRSHSEITRYIPSTATSEFADDVTARSFGQKQQLTRAEAMQSRYFWCKIAAHAAPQFEGISCANRSCMQKDSVRWHFRMWKLLLGCVSVYSSSGTAICIGLQVGHKCSEPDNGTALLNAICQPPGHAFKQIVQVC